MNSHSLKSKFIFILILISVSVNKIYAISPGFDDLSIVIASCDKYSGLWSPFFTLLFKNWPTLSKSNNKSPNKIPIFLIANKKEFYDPIVKNILFPNEISWSDNMLGALSQVKTKYILYLQEDYFLTAPVNEELLEQMLDYVKANNAAYLEIAAFNNSAQQVKPLIIGKDSINLAEFSKHSPYRTSLQAGIWDKEVLSWLIKSGETAVEFEQISSKRSEGMQRLFLAHVAVENDPIKYINAVVGGLLLKSALDHLSSQGIIFDPKSQSLPVDQNCKFTLLKRKIADFLITQETKANLKKFKDFLRKIVYF